MTLGFKDSASRLRIADILLIEEEEAEEDASGELLLMDGCTSVVSRWLSRLRTAKGKSISGQTDEREQDVQLDIRRSTDVLNGGGSLCTDTQSHHSGCGREPSFNVGVGCCLLYLIAASKNELDKMMELRTQMEMLLQNAKKELKTKDTFAKPFESNGVFAYSTIDAREGVESNCDHSPQNITTSYVLPESSTTMVCDQSLSCDTPKLEQCLEGRDRLEAELEAELERFLLQQRIEVTVKAIDSARSPSLRSGEIIDPVIDSQEECAEVHDGVPPCELERRLHEVLEARQQEQIRELEAALECARHKLHEKEIEVSWWKDTARLISQHIPAGTSRLNLEHDRETYHF